MSRWELLALGAILLMGMSLRLHAAFVSPLPDAVSLRGDARQYDEIGWNLASGLGFAVERDGSLAPTAQVAGPLYPIFLSLVYRVAGHERNAARLVQCGLGVLLVWIIFGLGRVLFDRSTGLLAAGFCALYPLTIRHSYFGGPAFLLSENLFIPLFCLSTLTLVHVTLRPTVCNQLAAGVCLGLSALARASMLTFPVVFLIWLVALKRRSGVSAVRVTVVVTAVMVLVVAPWTWRNYQVFNRFVPVSTLGGATFWHGNNLLARGGDHVTAPLPLKYSKGPSDEVLSDRLTFQAGWEALLADPWRVPVLLVRKVMVFWMIFVDTRDWEVNWPFLVSGLWALFGWWSSRHEPFRWLPVVVPAFYLTGIAMIFFGDPRYRAPVEPLLLILAASGVTVAVRRLMGAETLFSIPLR